jgi:hypothetical protein
MSPNLRQNDGVIVDSHFPFNVLKVGDIIVFKTYGTELGTGQHRTIVGRVAEIVNDSSNGQRIIRAKGDANPDSIPGVDYPIFQRNYIGKVVYVIPQLGAVLGAGNNSTNSGGNTAQSRGWYNNPGTNIGTFPNTTAINSTAGSRNGNR